MPVNTHGFFHSMPDLRPLLSDAETIPLDGSAAAPPITDDTHRTCQQLLSRPLHDNLDARVLAAIQRICTSDGDEADLESVTAAAEQVLRPGGLAALERLCQRTRHRLTEATAPRGAMGPDLIAAEFVHSLVTEAPFLQDGERTGRLMAQRILQHFDLEVPDWDRIRIHPDRSLDKLAQDLRAHWGPRGDGARQPRWRTATAREEPPALDAPPRKPARQLSWANSVEAAKEMLEAPADPTVGALTLSFQRLKVLADLLASSKDPACLGDLLGHLLDHRLVGSMSELFLSDLPPSAPVPPRMRWLACCGTPRLRQEEATRDMLDAFASKTERSDIATVYLNLLAGLLQGGHLPTDVTFEALRQGSHSVPLLLAAARHCPQRADSALALVHVLEALSPEHDPPARKGGLRDTLLRLKDRRGLSSEHPRPDFYRCLIDLPRREDTLGSRVARLGLMRLNLIPSREALAHVLRTEQARSLSQAADAIEAGKDSYFQNVYLYLIMNERPPVVSSAGRLSMMLSKILRTPQRLRDPGGPDEPMLRRQQTPGDRASLHRLRGAGYSTAPDTSDA